MLSNNRILHLLLMALPLLCASSLSLAQAKGGLMIDDHRAIIEDYDFFIEQLEAIHPDPYSAFGGEMGFRKKVDSLRIVLEKNENLDKEYLQRQITQFLIPLHDGHTDMCGF